MEAADIIKVILVVGAALAAGFSIKVVMSRRNSSKKDLRFVSQKNNTAGGDIVAGDSTKISHK